MANDSEFIEVLSPSALKDLQALNAEIVKTVANVKAVNDNMISVKTPSGSDSAIKSLNDKLIRQEKLYTELQIKLERYAQAQNRTAISNNNLTKSIITTEAAIERKNKAMEKEEAKASILTNVYNKTQRQLNLVAAEYNNLSAKKERYNNLNENEEKRLATLTNLTKKYQGVLGGIDQAIGKYGRNVGNYASGFNPLSNAIGQISRELPNFGQSMQIGIMSITNNIGALQDAIKGITAQNAILKAEGQATRSVMSQIGASILSFNTLLYVGVAVLSAYGKEIGNWVQSLFEGDKALTELTERQKEFNNAKLGGRKDAQAEILELRKYLAVLNDRKLSDEQRKIAQDALLKQYPFYIRSVKDAMLVDGQYSKGVNDLIVALEKRKEVEKKSELNVANRQKIIDLESELSIQTKLISKAQKLFDIESAKPIIADRAAAQANRNKLLIAEQNLNNAKEKGLSIEKQIGFITKQSIKNDTDIIKLKKETIGLEYQAEAIKNKSNAKTRGEQREDIEAITMQIDAQDGLLKKLKEIRSGYAELQQSTTNTREEFVKFTEILQYYDTLIDTIEKDSNSMANASLKTTEAFEKQKMSTAQLTEETKKMDSAVRAFLQSFESEFLNNLGLNSVAFFTVFEENGKTAFENLMEKADSMQEKFAITFNAVGEVAQDVFNKITELQNQRFENAFNNLEREKEIAIAFAGESTTAREEIERQYEARRAQLERKKAQQQKQTAIFNIIIDTAQAVVGALAEQNYGGAILFAALGAAQLAIVSSQQIPEYWKGTDNHEGGLMKINDKGLGQELVITPDGKGKIYKGKDVIVNAPKGTVVKTAAETALMFNDNLNAMLLNNGISMPKVEIQNSGYSDAKLNELIDVVKNKETVSINMNGSGFTKLVRNGHSTKEIQNDRWSFKGKSV